MGKHSRNKDFLNNLYCIKKASLINEHYGDTGIFALTVSVP
jgi:hypothetical protein